MNIAAAVAAMIPAAGLIILAGDEEDGALQLLEAHMTTPPPVQPSRARLDCNDWHCDKAVPLWALPVSMPRSVTTLPT